MMDMPRILPPPANSLKGAVETPGSEVLRTLSVDAVGTTSAGGVFHGAFTHRLGWAWCRMNGCRSPRRWQGGMQTAGERAECFLTEWVPGEHLDWLGPGDSSKSGYAA